jgi:CysZ protein
METNRKTGNDVAAGFIPAESTRRNDAFNGGIKPPATSALSITEKSSSSPGAVNDVAAGFIPDESMSQEGIMTERKLGFIDGFSCLFQGLRLTYGTKLGLAKYYLPPMILALLIVASAWVLFWNISDDIVRFVWAEPALNAWFGFKHLLWRVVSLVVFVASAGLVALSSVFLFSLLTASVNDLFSEKIEGILGTWTPRNFSFRFLITDLGHSAKFMFIRFCMKMAWLIPLFIASILIPVIGQAVYVFVGGYFLCKYTGMDYIDWCAARREISWKDRLAFGKTHKLAVCGLGAAVVLSFFIPLLFVVVWPGAVAGGTILFLKIEGAIDDASIERVIHMKGNPNV